jgi:hypothetical protein
MKQTQQSTVIALLAASLALPIFAQLPASITTPEKVESRKPFPDVPQKRG